MLHSGDCQQPLVLLALLDVSFQSVPLSSNGVLLRVRILHRTEA
jgi:hypothetical protein